MKPSILLILVLLVSVICFSSAAFAEDHGKGGEDSLRVEGDQVIPQRGRFLLAVADELRISRERVGEGITILECLIERITPLESPRREDHFRELLDWHHQLLDLYDNELEFFDTEFGRLPAKTQPVASDWHTHTLRLVKRQKMLHKELGEDVVVFRTEERAIAAIIKHRRQLQGHFDDLTIRISRLEEKLAGGKREPSRLPELRHELSVVQDELLMLPDIDDDVLVYYGTLTALAMTIDDWLSMKVERWQAFDGVADALAAGAGRKPRFSLAEALDGMIRTDRELIARLKRKIEEADTKREQFVPAGTIRKLERNQELDDLYMWLKKFYLREIGRLETAVGGFEADMQEAKPEQ